MRLHLDTNDLNAKLSALFAEEGLGVEEFSWGMNDEGPTLLVELGAMPSGANKPLRVVVADLQAEVDVLRSRVDQLESQPVQQILVQPEDEVPLNIAGKKKGRGKVQQPTTPSSPHSTPRVAAMAREIEREAGLVGPKLQPGERRLSTNETTEYPG